MVDLHDHLFPRGSSLPFGTKKVEKGSVQLLRQDPQPHSRVSLGIQVHEQDSLIQAGQARAQLKPRERDGRADLKWPGGRAGS